MSVFKKIQYISLMSSLFGVGSLVANPSPGQNSTPETKPPQRAPSGASFGGTGTHGRSGSVQMQKSTNPDGSKSFSRTGPEGARSDIQLNSQGDLVNAVFTAPDGTTTRVTAMSSSGGLTRSWNIVNDDSNGVNGTLTASLDAGSYFFEGVLPGAQESRRYNIQVDGNAVSITDPANGQVATANFLSDGTATFIGFDGTSTSMSSPMAGMSEEGGEGKGAIEHPAIAVVTILILAGPMSND